MKIYLIYISVCLVVITGCRQSENRKNVGGNPFVHGPDALPSWNEGEPRDAIISFVEKITDSTSENYLKPADRIAVFDNDGTLWAEQPNYFQGMFMLDKIKAMSPQHPEWKTKQPYKAVLENDMKALAQMGATGIGELMMVTHTGMTSNDFTASVKAWIDTAMHPQKHKLYKDLTYKPMKELIRYLQNNDFTTYIVSGGGVEFMRPWTESVYNIPPQQVIGSSIEIEFSFQGDTPSFRRLQKIAFVDDHGGKPVGIWQHIGKQPIAAFGNSDGDLQMLQYVTSGPGARLGMIIHHTDAAREWEYDRNSDIGRLDEALIEAPVRKWVVVDMKKDWNTIF